jgi:excisionase family DNA binding protein
MHMTEPTTPTRGPARLLHDIEEARQLLGGIGRSTLYKAIQGGRLKPVKIGARTMLPRTELERFASALSSAA